MLRKKEENLTEEDKEVLDKLFGYSPSLKKAYLFRDELTAIFDEKMTKPQAKRRLNGWMERVRRSGIRCFDDFTCRLVDQVVIERFQKAGIAVNGTGYSAVLSELLIEGLETTHLPGRTLDLTGSELSTHPGLVDAAPRVELSSREVLEYVARRR